MKDQFNEQKEILTSLKHEISLLQQQVDYLIRNERVIGLLDLDVMMNRTHTIYDQLCSINIGNPSTDDENLDIDPKMLNALFGLDGEEEENEETEARNEEEKVDDSQKERAKEADVVPEIDAQPEEEIPTEADIPTEAETPTAEEIHTEEHSNVEEETPADEDYGFIFKMEPLDSETNTEEEQTAPEAEEPIEEEILENDFMEEQTFENETVDEETVDEETIEEKYTEETSYSDPVIKEATGVINFDEEIPEKKNNVYTTGDEIEMVIPHFDFPSFDNERQEETPEEGQEEPIESFRDEESAEEPTPEEQSFLEEEPFQEEEPEASSVDEITEETDTREVLPEAERKEEYEDDFQYEPIIFGNMVENEEVGFEIETPETLGEKMQHEEDHSLAARLQSQSVRNLRSAIGINDKFLLVNELFSGSMEKYNRSIENLDDVKTLNGALIYLNELRIELQWNSNNEAYKKLLDLVHRKFES